MRESEREVERSAWDSNQKRAALVRCSRARSQPVCVSETLLQEIATHVEHPSREGAWTQHSVLSKGTIEEPGCLKHNSGMRSKVDRVLA